MLTGPPARETTILGNIAIQVPTQGVVKIGGDIVNQKDPAEHRVAMVLKTTPSTPT